MSISPKASMIWCICVAVLGVVAAGVLPSYVPTAIGKEIAETAAFLLAISASINGVLHAYSAPQAGPLVTKDAAK